jgi:hypothetical protein
MTAEQTADEAMGDYHPAKLKSDFAVAREIGETVLLPPVALLALGWIALWVFRGFKENTTT